MNLFSENGQNAANVKAICKTTPLYVKKRKKWVGPSLHGARLLIGCMESLFLILAATIFGLD
jgi:hypothetical protein